MADTINRLKDNTIEMTLTIPWDRVRTSYDAAVDKAVAQSELPGFRKGKAPKKLVEEKLDKTKVYEDVLQELIPQVYNEAVKKNNFTPIVTPRVELKDAKEGQDWVVRIMTCEKPEVKLGDYKKAVKELKSAKHKKVWVPGADEPAKDDKKEQGPSMSEVLEAVYKTIDVTIPSILTEHQVNRMLSDLIEQTRKLGLTVEQYLSSTGKTSEGIRAEYEEEAKRTLALEFAIEKIADADGVLVSDDDIDKIIKSGKTDKEKKSLEADRYYIASVLRRQKTLEHLASL